MPPNEYNEYFKQWNRGMTGNDPRQICLADLNIAVARLGLDVKDIYLEETSGCCDTGFKIVFLNKIVNKNFENENVKYKDALEKYEKDYKKFLKDKNSYEILQKEKEVITEKVELEKLETELAKLTNKIEKIKSKNEKTN